MPTNPNAIQPSASPAPKEGTELLEFIQSWVVDLTGLPGDLVRPRWQAEPPNIPDKGVCWVSVGVGTRRSDTYPFVGQPRGTPLGYKLIRQEELDLLCSFYDTGSTGQADKFAALLRDNTAIRQNNDLLRQNSFAFVSCGDVVPLPSLLKLQWLYRVDLPITLRRQIERDYPVGTVESVEIDLKANNAGDGIYEKTIIVQP